MVYVASDHAGFELKGKLVEYLKSKGFDVEDMGAHEYDPDDDYPDFVIPCAHMVAVRRVQGQDDWGIVVGGTGQAEAIAANKVKGIRAALFYGKTGHVESADVTGRGSDDPYEIVRLSREHNDTNVLSLGARFISEDDAKNAVDLWLSTKFDIDSRHQRRLEKIAKIEKQSFDSQKQSFSSKKNSFTIVK